MNDLDNKLEGLKDHLLNKLQNENTYENYPGLKTSIYLFSFLLTVLFSPMVLLTAIYFIAVTGVLIITWGIFYIPLMLVLKFRTQEKQKNND